MKEEGITEDSDFSGVSDHSGVVGYSAGVDALVHRAESLAVDGLVS